MKGKKWHRAPESLHSHQLYFGFLGSFTETVQVNPET